jgi:DNA-binding NarL/FixJ family response regulator
VAEVKTKIIIASGDVLTRSGLLSLTRQNLPCAEAAEAASLRDCERLLAVRCADFVLVDRNLLATRQDVMDLRVQAGSAVLAVLVSSLDQNRFTSLVHCGVDAVIPKSLSREEFLEALQQLESRERIAMPGFGAATPRASNDHDRVYPLTRRQHQVIQLAAGGRSNKEIARALNLSENTVKIHMSAAFRALGAHNRISAFAKLREIESAPQAGYASGDVQRLDRRRTERRQVDRRHQENGLWIKALRKV